MSSFRDKMLAKTGNLGATAERSASESSKKSEQQLSADSPPEQRRSSAFKTGPGMLGALADAKLRIQELETASDKLMLPVAVIQPNPWQPRKVFSEEALASLAESVREIGLIEPVVVRRLENGYQLIAGERRLRVHVMLALQEIKSSVIECSDQDMAVLALAENLGREDLADYEIGQSLRRAETEFPNRTRMAESLGLSRRGLYQFLAFESLPDFIKKDLDLKPRLLGSNAAEELVSALKKHGSRALTASQELWPAVIAGTLDQGKFPAAVVAMAARGSTRETASERSIDKFFAGKKHAGSITKDVSSFTIKIKADVLSDAQETQLRQVIAELFNVSPG